MWITKIEFIISIEQSFVSFHLFVYSPVGKSLRLDLTGSCSYKTKYTDKYIRSCPRCFTDIVPFCSHKELRTFGYVFIMRVKGYSWPLETAVEKIILPQGSFTVSWSSKFHWWSSHGKTESSRTGIKWAMFSQLLFPESTMIFRPQDTNKKSSTWTSIMPWQLTKLLMRIMEHDQTYHQSY